MERANEGANVLFGTVDALFGTADSGGMGNEEGKEHFAPPDAPAAVDSLSTTTPLVINRVTTRLTSPRRLILASATKNTSKNSKEMQLK